MCLTPKHSNLKVATKDMVVAKIVFPDKINKRICSAYQNGHIWPLGKTVTVKTKLGGDKSRKDVNKGLHACVSISAAKWRKKNFWTPERYRIYKAIIPKGAVYKIGTDDDIVSNKMKLVGPWKYDEKHEKIQ